MARVRGIVTGLSTCHFRQLWQCFMTFHITRCRLLKYSSRCSVSVPTASRARPPSVAGSGLRAHSPDEGNCIIRDLTRRRHAAGQLPMLQNPHSRGHGRRTSVTTPGALSVGAKKLAQRSPSSSTSAKKLALHESHSPTPGIKLALLAQIGPIWQVLPVHGELCTAVTANKPCRANFVPTTSWMRGQHTQQHTRPHRHADLQRKRRVTAVTTPGKVARNSIPSTLNRSQNTLKFQRRGFMV